MAHKFTQRPNRSKVFGAKESFQSESAELNPGLSNGRKKTGMEKEKIPTSFKAEKDKTGPTSGASSRPRLAWGVPRGRSRRPL